MIRVIKKESLYKKIGNNLHNFKLISFLGFFTLVIGLTLYLTTKQQDIRQRASGNNVISWGKIANSGHEGEFTKGIFFFAGPPNPSSLPLYTRNPLNSSQFNWSNSSEITSLFDEIKGAGTNVIKLSWWGTNNEYLSYAPTFNSVEVNKTVFAEAKNRDMLVAPLIEVSPAFKFYEEFPANTTNLETRIKSLLSDYGSETNWLTLYDKNLQPRKVIWLIETIHISSIDATQFAQAFDSVASKIEEATGQKIGFVIDPTPLPPNGSYFGPEKTALQSINSILAINPFNITSDGTSETERIAKAESILKTWQSSGIPLMVPVLPGYDDHIVRPPGQIYGDNLKWRFEMSRLALSYQTAGITLDIWNGFTEGYAFTPTVQNGSDNYNLASILFRSIPKPSPTLTPTNTPSIIPTITTTPIPTNTPAINTGKLNVKTIPTLSATIKIIKSTTGKIVMTGQGSINGALLEQGQYYVAFSYPKTRNIKTPRTTKFTISAGKTTDITGNFNTGKTTIKYY